MHSVSKRPRALCLRSVFVVPVIGLELTKPSLKNTQRLNQSFSWQCAIGELLRFPRNSKGFREDEFELRRGVETICSGVGSMHRFDTSNLKRFCLLLIKINEVVKVKLVELLNPWRLT
jgi:hypothetical protein